MATIKEIAKACNVSIATVSNILNGKENAGPKTRKIVLNMADELGYVPNYMAKNLKQHRTKLIGIITEDLTVFNCPEIVDGIHDYLEAAGYNFVLGNLRLYKKYNNDFIASEEYRSQVENEFRIMEAKQIEGIIYVCAHSRVVHFIPEKAAVPVVLAYGKSDNPNYPAVVYNDEQGAYDAVSELIKRGRKSIGVITGEEKSSHTRQRMTGYQRALFEHKILFDPGMIYHGNWERESGYSGAEYLTGRGTDAIFSMNDMMAAGIYDYAAEKQIKIGEDLSLIGFDNREICEVFRPGLTTMVLPLGEIGRKSAEIALEAIREKKNIKEDMKDIGRLYEINCRIIRRSSI